MFILYSLLLLMLQPLGLEKEIASPNFNVRVKAARSLHEMTDLSFVGLIILSNNKDPEVVRCAEQQIDLRIEDNNRLQIRKRFKDLHSIVPPPVYGEFGYNIYEDLYLNIHNLSIQVREFYTDLEREKYWPSIVIEMYSHHIISITELILFLSHKDNYIMYNRFVFEFEVMNYLRLLKPKHKDFWITLAYIKYNDLFFVEDRGGYEGYPKELYFPNKD